MKQVASTWRIAVTGCSSLTMVFGPCFLALAGRDDRSAVAA